MENFKINREKKTFVFDDGEEIPIPKDKVKQVLRSKAGQQSKQEAVEKWKQFSENVPAGEAGHTFLNNLSENVLGNIGDTAANYAVSGYKALTPGEGQEEMGYVDRILDHFYAMQEGRKEHLAEQSAKSPNSALAGTIGGIGLELGALGRLPAKAALPIMGAGHSETSFLEPSEKIPEVAQEAVIGTLLDKFFGAASKVAGHRQTRRGIQDAIRTTEEANAAELSRVASANAAEEARFASETAAREGELARLPQLQQAENEAFANSSAQKVEIVAQTLGKTPIAAEALGVENFIENVVEGSAHAASKEGGIVKRFLRTIVKTDANGKITGQGIQKAIKAVDDMIIKSTGAVKEMMTEFRNFTLQNLPQKIGNFYAYEKWMPKIQARVGQFIEKDLTRVFKGANDIYVDVQGQLGRNVLTDLNKSIQKSVDEIFLKHSGNFEEALSSGTIRGEIKAAIENNPLYQALMDDIYEYHQIVGKNKQYGEFRAARPNVNPAIQDVKSRIADYPELIADRVGNVIDRYLPDIGLDISTKSGITENAFQKMPTKPNLVPEPPQVNPAQQMQPNLSPVPQMPQPQGVLERLAFGLEGIGETGFGGLAKGIKDNASTGLLAKMAGVPLGKMAAGAAGLVSGLSALTSPSALGRAARTGLEQTARMMDAVNQRASQYPSHAGNGILNDPMERRSLVKEIEDDLNMKLEDKAIIQAKVNRGQPLIPELGR